MLFNFTLLKCILFSGLVLGWLWHHYDESNDLVAPPETKNCLALPRGTAGLRLHRGKDRTPRALPHDTRRQLSEKDIEAGWSPGA